MKRILKPIALLLCVVFVLAFFSGCDTAEKGSLLDGRKYFCYEQLDDAQKNLYLSILDNLSAGEDMLLLFDVKGEVFEKVYGAVIDDHPELFWLSGVYTYYENSLLGLNYLIIEPEFYIDEDELEEYRQRFDAKVEEIAGYAEALGSDYEKACYVHDYIVKNTEYDYELSEKITTEEETNHLDAYNCLINGSAVCQGYTTAFEVIMNKLSVPCGSVLGKSTVEDGEQSGDVYHVWNFIELEGENYYIDVTWGDPHPDEKEHYDVNYEYFCITSEELLRTHEISSEENLFVPECNGKKYNYFAMEEMLAEKYSFSLISDIISKQIENDTVYVKFSSGEELKKAIKQLFDKRRVFDIDAVYNSVESVSYTTGYSELLLYIFLEK